MLATMRRDRCAIMMSLLLGRAGEHVFDREIEQFGDLESEGQRRVVAARLDRVDALSTDLEQVAQMLLAPPAIGTERAEVVVHASRRSISLLMQPPTPSPANHRIGHA